MESATVAAEAWADSPAEEGGRGRRFHSRPEQQEGRGETSLRGLLRLTAVRSAGVRYCAAASPGGRCRATNHPVTANGWTSMVPRTSVSDSAVPV